MNSLISFVSLTNLPEDPGFATYFSHLLRTKTCTDVVFVLETPDGSEVEFFAHQLILALRSSYFADQFYGSDRNKEDPFQKIRLKRINPKAFEDMIKYCYGCKPSLENTDEAYALFKLANKFKVVSLMNLCRTSLRDIEIDAENVFSMLEIAESMQDNSQRDKCNKILEEETREVLAAYDLRDVTVVMAHIIIDLPKLSLYSEYELINWMIKWAIAKVEEGDSNCSNAREFLEKLLQELNFLALTFEEFAMLCKDYPDFFSLEEIALIYLNIAHPGTREMPDFYDKDVKFRQYTGSKN